MSCDAMPCRSRYMMAKKETWGRHLTRWRGSREDRLFVLFELTLHLINKFSKLITYFNTKK
jgi:hypothetical protein